MRITTSMLNETAKRTGIPINQPSLLSYINNESESGGNTLLDALKNSNKVSSTAAANYKKLQKSADSLKEQAEKLAQTGEESFLEKIKNSENKEEAYQAVEDYIQHYNATLSGLSKSSGTLDQYYSMMLKDAVDDKSEALEKIGITADKNGKLSVDTQKLREASIEDIQSVFGGANGLAAKTAFIAEKASDNAAAGTESVSGQYDAAGNIKSYLAGKFDFFG